MPQPHVAWRTEVREFRNQTPAFPDGTSAAAQKADGFVVSSLGISF
jgi:hypothetical protein